MMPELGKYVVEVLLAYAVTGLLLAGLILSTLWSSRRVKAQLQDVEGRNKDQKKNG
ncbi:MULTISPECIES: heme exporter protein CcmD [Halocynthiibacter]|uniref:Heme exporter protein D n=1 Tax=Halocynthiibacter halioticoli TaxID=2986804 RepID=A0AAE3IXP2_9RHOB|nr:MULTISPECIES: heme exporter protein CcmD [Halocynthiibacter]MCV6824050.1 heme exporter protein CcmD [Halocynthiibacter halioticoli]MCW4057051.1 heme exporter protein CcmD [Halocynthiibacter sp. SDUM655004]MDE0589923.1 heme exporter protein CcmD [Halocynthiibacter sp. C4]